MSGAIWLRLALGGAGDRINLVPQSSTLNRKDWKAMENYLRKELEAGKTVSIKMHANIFSLQWGAGIVTPLKPSSNEVK